MIFDYDEFQKWQNEVESIKRYAKLFEIVPDKGVYFITLNSSLREKHLITNILVLVDYKFIVMNISDFFLFISELEIFQVDETAKFVEYKSKKTSNGVINSLKVKVTNTYLSKQEIKAIIRSANKIEKFNKFVDSSYRKQYENVDYIKDLLIKSKINIK